ncbi:hypothetical protein GCM10010195_47440 [Kitasatospora griseola]|nr:hypothetical protein GCM10010195_47440 [Kitasatospora griseola]
MGSGHRGRDVTAGLRSAACPFRAAPPVSGPGARTRRSAACAAPAPVAGGASWDGNRESTCLPRGSARVDDPGPFAGSGPRLCATFRRQFEEALTHGPDPLHLAEVFGLDETAMRYADSARALLQQAAEQPLQ